MQIRELQSPTPRELRAMEAVLTASFWRTPMFTGYLFRGRRLLARLFLAAMLRYSLRAGRVFVAAETDGTIAACALWSTPESPDIDVKAVLHLGLWPYFLALMLLSPAAMRRVGELFAMLEAHAPQPPYATVEFLASSAKGAGAAVLRHSMNAFPGLPLYVESIVSKNDHAFYRGFGFKSFDRTDFHGTDYAFLMLMPQSNP